MVVRIKFKRKDEGYVMIATSKGQNKGRLLDTLGYYSPKGLYSYLEVDIKKFKYWVESGGQCSKRVLKVMNESIERGGAQA